MTPIQLEQKKRLLAQIAGSVASGLVKTESLTVVPKLSVCVALEILQLAEEATAELFRVQSPEIPPDAGKQPWGEDGWGA